MTVQKVPVFYSFRRCPFAMRARLALVASGQQCELREILLRDKPAEMVDVSPKGTVPVLIDVDGRVLEESLDIMLWALGRKDPMGWLAPDAGDMDQMLELVGHIDGPFKFHLDRYKYSSRYCDEDGGRGGDAQAHRDQCMDILVDLDRLLQQRRHLFGNRISLADAAIAPFVRQFANTNAEWFKAQSVHGIHAWLEAIVGSDLFGQCMQKFPVWRSGTNGVPFPN